MRVFCLANNWAGWQAVKYLRSQGETIVGLALHPPAREKYSRDILAAAGVAGWPVYLGDHINDPESITAVQALQPDLCLSVFFGYLLKPAFLAAFPGRVVNLHPAYLPWNRGANPNVWPLVDGSPAGATLHYVDAGVDTGDIIARLPVAVQPADTGATLYRRLERACLELLADTWPRLRAGTAGRIRQDPAAGSTHKQAELASLDALDLDAPTTARALLGRLRARTFPPYRGCYYVQDGERVYVRVELSVDRVGNAQGDQEADKGNGDRPRAP